MITAVLEHSDHTHTDISVSCSATITIPNCSLIPLCYVVGEDMIAYINVTRKKVLWLSIACTFRSSYRVITEWHSLPARDHMLPKHETMEGKSVIVVLWLLTIRMNGILHHVFGYD